jgi:hypothetical protein
MSLPAIGVSKLADFGRRTVRRLAEFGIAVATHSRLPLAIGRLDLARDQMARGDELSAMDREFIGEAARDCFELYLASHAQAAPLPEVVLGKFRTALAGAPRSSAETNHRARDIQFELFVWGLMTASGNECRFAEPPDLVVHFGDHELSIAVKRIWSPAQARKRLSAGAAQIRRSKISGILAVNAQQFVGEDPHQAHNRGARVASLDDALARLHGHLPQVLQEGHVIGALFSGLTFAWITDETQATTFSNQIFHQLVLFSDNADERLAFAAAWARHLRALQGWTEAHM